jgi:hypothetical protein
MNANTIFNISVNTTYNTNINMNSLSLQLFTYILQKYYKEQIFIQKKYFHHKYLQYL